MWLDRCFSELGQSFIRLTAVAGRRDRDSHRLPFRQSQQRLPLVRHHAALGNRDFCHADFSPGSFRDIGYRELNRSNWRHAPVTAPRADATTEASRAARSGRKSGSSKNLSGSA